MDRVLNSSVEKQSIYEIFRACRLCGAGGGYKMPIIQNVVDLDGSDVELKQKIRECVQIEVHPDDKMPPLICELCIDKVNDFYEFLDMCKQINKRTRLRLGLPPQTMPMDAPDAGDCILGVTEPVFINEDSNEPLSKHKIKGDNIKIKKELTVIIKKEPKILKKIEAKSSIQNAKSSRSTNMKTSKNTKQSSPEANWSNRNKKQSSPEPTRTKRGTRLSSPELLRSCRSTRQCSPEPIRATRSTRQSSPELNRPSRSQDQHKMRSDKVLKFQNKPKSIMKKVKIEENYPLELRRLKRGREKTPPKHVPPLKKVKLEIKPEPKCTPNSKSASTYTTPSHQCKICKQSFKTSQSLSNHLKSHAATYTNSKMACNACGFWFKSLEETMTHHRRHSVRARPYYCKRCQTTFKQYDSYNNHFEKKLCTLWDEVPDVQCNECWQYFPTDNLRSMHKCPGENGRRGGKCGKCKRTYTTMKSLKKHESICTVKRKEKLIVNPEILEQVKPLQVRIVKCDSLLKKTIGEHYDVSLVPPNYGLDESCIYPYLARHICIKTEPNSMFNAMVNIPNHVEEYDCHDYIHWDSEYETESDNDDTCSKIVESLTTLTLKIIFSEKCLGKVPKKRKKVKVEKNLFDSTLNASEFDTSLSNNINNIIDNLRLDDTNENYSSFKDIVEGRDATVMSDSDESISMINNVRSDFNNIFDSLLQSNKNYKSSENIREAIEADKEISNHRQHKASEATAKCNSEEKDLLNIVKDNDIEENTHVTHNLIENNKFLKVCNVVTSNDIETTVEKQPCNEADNFRENTNIDDSAKTNNKKYNKEESVQYDNHNIDNNDTDIEKCNNKDQNSFCTENVQKDIDSDRGHLEESKNCKLNNEELDRDSEIFDDNIDKMLINKKNSSLDSISNNNSSDKLVNVNKESDKTDNTQICNNDLICKLTDNENKNNENIIRNIITDNSNDDRCDNLTKNIYLNVNSNQRICKNSTGGELKEERTVVNGTKSNKFNIDNSDDISETEMDDKKLMDAINDQIGETDHVINETNKVTDKITIDDIVPKKDYKSTALDAISDEEFNFDA